MSTVPARAAPAPQAEDDGVPEDLRFRPGFVPAPLDDQLKVARKVLAAWREQNESRTQRERGHGAMHPITYAQGLQIRRSLVYTLLQLKAEKENPA